MFRSVGHDEVQRLCYRYLAYLVIRDAIGFYFGIPKFLSTDHSDTYKSRLDAKLDQFKERIGRELTQAERDGCAVAVELSIKSKIVQLSEDFEHCKSVLFDDNLWLQWLDLDPEFLKGYLGKLTEEQVNELAVVPTWSTRDHSLGRPYLTDERDVTQISFQ